MVLMHRQVVCPVKLITTYVERKLTNYFQLLGKEKRCFLPDFQHGLMNVLSFLIKEKTQENTRLKFILTV